MKINFICYSWFFENTGEKFIGHFKWIYKKNYELTKLGAVASKSLKCKAFDQIAFFHEQIGNKPTKLNVTHVNLVTPAISYWRNHLEWW